MSDLRYAINELIAASGDASIRYHRTLWHRIKFWWSFRKNKAPYWSDRLALECAIYSMNRAIELLRKYKRNQSNDGETK